MSVLTLRLASPLQSWGAASRFTRRATESAPTKSGILGLLAAAEGRRRSDPIEDLLSLELAVRTDQQGVLLRDFHTAHHQTTGAPMPLTERFYWSDAVFLAFIGGPREVLEGLHSALANPAYPLFFGRRSCVPEGRVSLGVQDLAVAEAAHSTRWSAGQTARRRARGQERVRLAVQADQSVYPDLPPAQELNDVPLSWDPERRLYRTRPVVETYVSVPTGHEGATPPLEHDPMAALGGEVL